MFGPSIMPFVIRQARFLRSCIMIVLLAVAAAPAFAAATAGKNTSPAAASLSPEPSSIAAAGYFSARYVFRSAVTSSQEHFRDQDIFGELRMDVTSPRSGRYEFHFLGTVRSDLDGNQDVTTFNPLEDIGNTVAGKTFGNIYEAHLDINNLTTRLTQIRLGRQSGTRDEAIFFDGIAADVRLMPKVNVTLYGGAAVHFYEINWKEGDDSLGGAGIDYTPSAWTGMSLDYLSVSDKRDYLTFTNQKDNLLSFRLWQRFSQYVKATAKYRYQDGESRDLALRLLGTFPDHRAEFGIAYIRQFSTQQQQTNELSPFTDVMGASYPYQTVDLKLRKLFGERFAVDLGYYHRTVLDGANIGSFNQDYSRTSGAFTISDLLIANLSCMVAGDRWSSTADDSYSGSIDLTYQFRKSGRASIGTYYSLYKYDNLYQLEEHDRVRTYYVSARLPLMKQFALNGSYELEKGLDTYHVMKAGIRYDF
jgi:predicted porin